MYGRRTQAYGETNYLRKKTKVLDRTKVLYGPQTQANGETNYLRINKGFEQNQGIVWSSTSTCGQTNYLNEKTKVLDRTKALYGPRTQAYGKPIT